MGLQSFHSCHRFLVVTLLLGVFTFSVWGQTVTTYDEAVEWLDSNQRSPQFGSVLYTAVEHAPSVEAVGTLLDEYLQDVMDRTDRGRILLRAGIVQELAHQYNRARLSYARAVDADPTLWEASIRRSALAIEEGDLSEAVLLLTQAIHQAPTRDLQRHAAMLRIRAYSMQGDLERAFEQAAALAGYSRTIDIDEPSDIQGTVEPEALLMLHETAQLVGNARAQEWSVKALANSFGSDVPESSLARDGDSPDSIATFYPSPSRIFGGVEIRSVPIVEQRVAEDSTSPEEGSRDDSDSADDRRNNVEGIQTGSFRDRENAEYMARDIRKLEFSAEVREVEIDGGTFFRVIVPLPEDATTESAQETVVRLKEQGIEGFLVFQSP
jgi:hypothetical protein